MRRVCMTMRGTRVGHQCLCVGTGLKPRTSTSVHWRPTFVSRMNRARITFIPLTLACTWNVREACVFGRAPSVIHASGVSFMFVEYCTVFARMRRRAWYVSDCKWYVRGSCVIRQWFLPPNTPKNLSISRRTNTQKPNLWVIRTWSAVWLVLYVMWGIFNFV
jgi:hypothetical protein